MLYLKIRGILVKMQETDMAAAGRCIEFIEMSAEPESVD
jgi:hypothetical protein